MKIFIDVGDDKQADLLAYLKRNKIPYEASEYMARQFFTLAHAQEAIEDCIRKRGQKYEKIPQYYAEEQLARKILAILQGRVTDGFSFDDDALWQVTSEVLFACCNSISELTAYRARIADYDVPAAERKEIENFILYQGYPHLLRIRPFVQRVREAMTLGVVRSLAACLRNLAENTMFSSAASLHDTFYCAQSDLHRLFLVEAEKHPEIDHAGAAFLHFAPRAELIECRKCYLELDAFLLTGVKLTSQTAVLRGRDFVPAIFEAALPLFSFPSAAQQTFSLQTKLLPAFRAYAEADSVFARSFAKSQLFSIRKGI